MSHEPYVTRIDREPSFLLEKINYFVVNGRSPYRRHGHAYFEAFLTDDNLGRRLESQIQTLLSDKRFRTVGGVEYCHDIGSPRRLVGLTASTKCVAAVAAAAERIGLERVPIEATDDWIVSDLDE